MHDMLEQTKRDAWGVLMCTTNYHRVALQIGWLIDHATNVREILLALAMIGEFELEEEGAEEEARLNAQLET